MHLFFLILKFIISIFIIQFHISHYRIGYNPIAAKLNKLTYPLILPFTTLAKFIRYDIATLIVAWIFALLGMLILSPFNFALKHSIFWVLDTWLDVFFLALILVVIASWLQTSPQQPVLQIALCCTEWAMSPLRRIIPPLGGMDFSVLIAFLLNEVLRYVITQLFWSE